MRDNIFLWLLYMIVGLGLHAQTTSDQTIMEMTAQKYVVVLGIAQDAGYPQAGCTKTCCEVYWNGEETQKYVISLGIVDKANNQMWMIEATPDFNKQLRDLQTHLENPQVVPNGIFLTHAHIGHYTGLMHLGREVIGAKDLLTYVMPRMADFLTNNAPWSQLVKINNLRLEVMEAEKAVDLNNGINLTPFLVPHRDEYSETVGYKIESEKSSLLFIPDIDKWEMWEKDLKEEIKKVEAVLIDGTFYQNGEIPNRDMSEIPHPFIEESMKFLQDLEDSEKAKVYFIHLNHTNPLLRDTPERKAFLESGFKVVEQGQVFEF